MTSYRPFFQLVLPFADGNCYPGSGNAINLATVGNDTDYYIGDNVHPAEAPTFYGSVNSLDRSSGFEAVAGGEVFKATNPASTLWSTVHKPGCGGIAIACLELPVSLPAVPIYILANAETHGGGQGAGAALRLGTLAGGFTMSLLVRGTLGASRFSQSSPALGLPNLIAGNRCLVAAGWQDGQASAWFYMRSTAGAAQFATFKSFYDTTAASAAAPNSPPWIWQNGNLGTDRAGAGTKINCLLASTFAPGDTFISVDIVTPLLRSLERMFLEDLP